MQSSKLRAVFGLLIMLVGVAAILIKFDKMPGVRLNGGTGRIEFSRSLSDDAPRAEDKKPSLADDLRLGGLSGPASRRLAIVNNETFAAGESARLKVAGELVKVQCQEIRANSVVVHVEGTSEPVEIFLEGAGVPDAVADGSPRAAPASPVPPPAGSTVRAENVAEKVAVISAQIPASLASVQADETNGTVEVLVGGQKIQVRP